MKTGVLKKGIRPRAIRAGRLALLGATLVAGIFVASPASAKLPLDIGNIELPPLLPLPLPTLTPSVEQPVSGTIDTVTKTVTGVTEELGGVTGGDGGTGTTPGTLPVVRPRPQVDSWSLERLPGLQGTGAASEMARTTVSSARLDRPGAYTSLIGNGIRTTAGRAAELAGPLAAPIVVALFALALLALAARGPGRFVKVDEERQTFRDRRTHRL
jgi:hypothetical protein